MDNPSFRWIDSYSLFDIKTLKRKELVMNNISTKGKMTIIINIILYPIGLKVHLLYLDMHVSPYIFYGILLLMIVDLIVLFSKYLLRGLKAKELEPKLIILFTIPIVSLIASYIETIIIWENRAYIGSILVLYVSMSVILSIAFCTFIFL